MKYGETSIAKNLWFSTLSKKKRVNPGGSDLRQKVASRGVSLGCRGEERSVARYLTGI
jgi:hypothetical protein